ncbi:Asp-tRNA(Asn)/Glu-tRNA(Gln) amidotransferase subunit GatC [Carnobacteriaceae bacterium zg-ZUI78]|uniref:Asp-tRNA(Asn)/Glu-tRNA(Gln) amidotransferase subunit GatC n=1 Tax=Granulicatella sp. zg-84 TaxID=2678503 RepID=UPI0013C0CA94|nr:Asp-tRNA(Asn)/Glu-tRNA(Gln) amidotransferase subunit GatC [Granulicatella sp. zg-84]MBS4751040.1 Asp-tRNA(Asn)/Glu-tRNA(Gln) amidotransferase subunit GatC [Carnobacteriaceae bacterium zg-ZUI78]NEW65590.1 Asp-tRNA(Asn)/Glu-tRNA(Gln) amidotransferase subunit GatC [Granulicatella sp. zg-84]QMI85531.1 Asp-tRNA(Asn)/Glu-tRNA(Gln) amidotransferase subunit GatC [Carnobacteriaceae bacterium zg-84]
MAITEKDVYHVAKLAKLSFKENEIVGFTEKLSNIIDMVEQLNEVDTTGVPVTTHGYPVVNVFREDIAEQGTDRTELFENVPHGADGFIKVPAMIEGGGDA